MCTMIGLMPRYRAELRMEVVKRTKFRSLLIHRKTGRGECSAPQMRGGFVVLNLLAWIIILVGLKFLA